MTVKLIAHATHHDAGIDAPESERITHNIIEFGGATAIWHDVEIAGRIGILVIDRRRDPLSIQRERTKCGLDRAGRTERVRIITFRPTYRDVFGMRAEYLFDVRRFRAVVQLCRAGVGVDVIDLLRRDVRVRKRVAHGPNARFAAGQGRGHVESIVVQTVSHYFRIDACAACPSVFQFLNDERSGAFPHDKSVP